MSPPPPIPPSHMFLDLCATGKNLPCHFYLQACDLLHGDELEDRFYYKNILSVLVIEKKKKKKINPWYM